jgi:hypothetical protein
MTTSVRILLLIIAIIAGPMGMALAQDKSAAVEAGLNLIGVIYRKTGQSRSPLRYRLHNAAICPSCVIKCSDFGTGS